jgi:putative copper export protein
MTFGLIVLAAFLLVIFGMVIGCALSERWLQGRARRQAATQRSINRQWQELQAEGKKFTPPYDR